MTNRLASAWIMTVLIAFSVPACSTGGAEQAGLQAGKSKDGVSRVELQDALLRFETGFFESMRGAFKGLDESNDLKVRNQALKQRLAYAASALDIAIGPVPEANLLDMVAFIELCRNTFRNYWMPELYGDLGEPVARALDTSNDEIWKLASSVLSPQQMSALQSVIQAWQKEHPDQKSVEAVRITEFAAETGAQAGAQAEVSGLLSSVKKATVAADRAVSLGERALHYAQRAPFLLRMQIRASVSEILSTALGDLSSLPEFRPDLDHLNELIVSGDTAVKDGTVLVDELRQLMELVYQKKNLEASRLLKDSVWGGYRILEQYNRALSSPVHAQSMAALRGMTDRMEAAADRVMIKAGVGLLVVIGFTGLVVLGVRIAYARWAESRRRGGLDQNQGPPKSSAA